MELFKILFWIATLYGCLQAAPTALQCNNLKISEIRKDIICLPDSTFYTPDNVKDECITAALDCVKMELYTVKDECGDPNEYVQQGIAALDKMIGKRPGHGLKSSECPCERWPQTPLSNFLNKTEELCQLTHVKSAL